MKMLFGSLVVLSVGLSLFSTGAHAKRKEPVLGAAIIDRLIDPVTRTEALREIRIATQSEDPVHDWSELPLAAFEIYHKDIRVTLCPQINDAEPIYLVTFRSDYNSFANRYSNYRHGQNAESSFAPVPDKYKPEDLREGREPGVWRHSEKSPNLSLPPDTKLGDCVFVFLTSEGKVIWPFSGDNIGEGDRLKDLNGDGRYERVFSSNFMVYDKRKGDPDIWVQTLRIEAVSPESERCFHVILNWHKRDSVAVQPWGWTLRDMEDDGMDELVLGPIIDKEAEPEATVVYHWDSESGRYMGPEGDLETHFLLLDPEASLWDELRRVRDAGGLRYEGIAAAAMAPPAEEPAPLAYDWRVREPYQHHSLASATNEALFNIMCGWRPGEPCAPGESVVASPSQQFEFKDTWFDLPPKEAAFAFAAANQGEKHLKKFVLYYPIKPVQPPEADWLILSSMSGPGMAAVRLSGEDAGAAVSVRYRRPLPEKYPAGDHNWEWTKRQLDPGRMRWLRETLWWLTQLRSEPKEPEARRISSSRFSTNCYPTYMETSTPGLRLLKEGEAAAIDISGERLIRYAHSWREEFGAEVYLGFASILYENCLDRFSVRKEERLTTQEVFDQTPRMLEGLISGRLPAEVAEAMIRASGDHAEVAALATLQRLEANMSPASDLELELERLEQALAALPNKIDIETYKAKVDLEMQLADVQRRLRDEPWFGIRQPLQFTMRQLEAANDPEALLNWALRAGEPGAIWALSRLSEIDKERSLKVLETVFAEAPEWRSKIISDLILEHPDVAKQCVARLPRVDQLRLMPTLAGHSSRAEVDAQLLTDLLETVQSDELPVQTRREALRKLAPRDQPLKLPQLEIDETFRQVMEDEFRRRGDPWPAQGLAFELGMMLLMRNQVDLPVELYLEAAAIEQSAYNFTSFMPLVLHLSVVQNSDRAHEWISDWVQDCIEKDEGAWNRLAETIFAADLRNYAPFLARLATLQANEPEGASGKGKGRHPELENGDRYHMPRRILTVWQEPDSLTRAKCLFLLGFTLNYQYLGEGIYRPIDRVEQSLRETFELLQSVERKSFADFIQWCAASIHASHLDYQARKYLERMAGIYKPSKL